MVVPPMSASEAGEGEEADLAPVERLLAGLADDGAQVDVAVHYRRLGAEDSAVAEAAAELVDRDVADGRPIGLHRAEGPHVADEELLAVVQVPVVGVVGD